VSRFPSSDFDLAFTMEDETPAGSLLRALRQAGGSLATTVELFDVYRGPGVSQTGRSLAYRIRLQADDRTLTDAEVGAVRDACIAAAAKIGAILR
jgi:phenylalanyl-tRNA synthetase beta chain